MTTAFPLAWPDGRPRTPWNRRRRGGFTSNEKAISRVDAMRRLEQQLSLLGAVYPIVSSDLVLRQDGQPHLGKPEPQDPGVCVYFQLAGRPYAMACDSFDRLAQNLAAIAQHIEATRRTERYGVASAADTLKVFEALPAPKQPHEILGVAPDATAAAVRTAWRTKIGDHHPDRAGTHSAAAEINAARDEMLRRIG